MMHKTLSLVASLHNMNCITTVIFVGVTHERRPHAGGMGYVKEGTVDLAITFVILDTLNIFLIDWFLIDCG